MKQQMEAELDLEKLQEQFTQLEQMEMVRERLYLQLDDVV